MKENKTKPDIRFKGFTEAWEQRKLGELSSSFEYGLNAAAKEYDGENKYIRITDIDDDSRKFKQEDITSPDTDLSSAENYRLSEGDILFARTGASVGKSYIYKASDGLVYYAGFLIRAKIKKDYNPEFVFQNTLTNDYEKFIKITSMRSGQPGVNAQEYSQYQIMMPCKIEQDRISGYLRSLDNLITLHQRECDQLKELKKSMLKKMFPRDGSNIPEVRFAGFTDAWEQRKLIEVCDYVDYRGKTPKKTKTGIFLVTAKNVKDGYIDYEASKEYISYKDYDEVMKRGIPEIGDILFTTEAPCGNVAQVDKPNIALAQRIIKYRGKDNIINNNYLKCYLLAPTFQKNIDKKSSGGTVQGIKGSVLHQQTIQYPSYIEQQKVGMIFNIIDNLITLHQRELEILKNLKKTCLKRMFI